MIEVVAIFPAAGDRQDAGAQNIGKSVPIALGYRRNPSATLNAALIRDCQPAPPSRKPSMTSGSIPAQYPGKTSATCSRICHKSFLKPSAHGHERQNQTSFLCRFVGTKIAVQTSGVPVRVRVIDQFADRRLAKTARLRANSLGFFIAATMAGDQ